MIAIPSFVKAILLCSPWIVVTSQVILFAFDSASIDIDQITLIQHCNSSGHGLFRLRPLNIKISL